MAKYRCPECGASHKEHDPYCRLCGAPMDQRVVYQSAAPDPSIAASRFDRRGLGHFIIIGAIVGLVVVAGAVWLGVVEGGDDVRSLTNDIPGVGGASDKWFTWPDPDEVILVEVPAIPEEADDPLSLSADADTVHYQVEIGDTVHNIAFTQGLDFTYDEDTPSEARALLETTVADLAPQQEGVVQRQSEVFTWQGYPAVDVTYDGLSLPGGPAFGTARIFLADGEIFLVETVDYDRNPDSYQRIRDSIVVVADQPDVTIPTIPSDAPASGGVVADDGE